MSAFQRNVLLSSTRTKMLLQGDTSISRSMPAHTATQGNVSCWVQYFIGKTAGDAALMEARCALRTVPHVRAGVHKPVLAPCKHAPLVTPWPRNSPSHVQAQCLQRTRQCRHICRPTAAASAAALCAPHATQ
jgi:hypothetical protein